MTEAAKAMKKDDNLEKAATMTAMQTARSDAASRVDAIRAGGKLGGLVGYSIAELVGMAGSG